MRFRDERLSYESLAVASNKLARALYEAGVVRGDRVGIHLDKCIEIPVALHGIMKAGAAYVPLDPAAPAARLREIVRDCGIRHVVTASSKLAALQRVATDTSLTFALGVEAPAAADGGLACVPWSHIASLDGSAAPPVKVIESDLAYIIYTSGSTGIPKGIMHTHHSSLSFSRWAAHEYGFRPDDVLSNHAPLHFDLSIMDFFSGAVAGCATAIVPEEYTKFPASYAALIAEQGITVLYTVPFALVQLLLRGSLEKHDLSRLRWAIFGGEPMPVGHLRALMQRLPHVRFDNIYGPAEVNGVTHHTISELPEDADAIPVGPIADTAEALVVDDADEPVARGGSGELLVRSPSMMLGYWARPDLNAHAFFRRERMPGVEDVFYRTGDLVREDVEGRFWFLGRKDRQVKVRGYRVELDEVEAALLRADAVEEAAAVTVPGLDGSSQIVAMVTLKPGRGPAELATVADAARGMLPAYAMPVRIEPCDAFPRTATGKIDRKALQAAELARTANGTGEEVRAS